MQIPHLTIFTCILLMISCSAHDAADIDARDANILYHQLATDLGIFISTNALQVSTTNALPDLQQSKSLCRYSRPELSILVEQGVGKIREVDSMIAARAVTERIRIAREVGKPSLPILQADEIRTRAERCAAICGEPITTNLHFSKTSYDEYSGRWYSRWVRFVDGYKIPQEGMLIVLDDAGEFLFFRTTTTTNSCDTRIQLTANEAILKFKEKMEQSLKEHPRPFEFRGFNEPELVIRYPDGFESLASPFLKGKPRVFYQIEYRWRYSATNSSHDERDIVWVDAKTGEVPAR